MRPYTQIFTSIQKQFHAALTDFQSEKFLKEKKEIYTLEEKRKISYHWSRIVRSFRELRKIIRRTSWSQYFFFHHRESFVVKYFAVMLYYNHLVELQRSFGVHEEFIRQYLDDTFHENYSTLARYMYRLRFYLILIYPHEYILNLRNEVHISLDPLFDIPISIAGDISDRFSHDRVNVWYYIRYRMSLLFSWTSRTLGKMIDHIMVSRRKKSFLETFDFLSFSEELTPGDIFLSRRNWSMTNIGIPGFWKHMSMYIGTGKYVQETFHIPSLSHLIPHGHYIIEAVGTGVRIVSISEFLSHADYLACIRPRFSQIKKEKAISIALSHMKREYDYAFNYYSDRNFVCSTLVTKAYLPESYTDEGIHIDLVRVGTGITYPPHHLVEKMIQDKRLHREELDLVFFLNASEKEQKAFLDSEKAFFDTYKYPRMSFFLK